MGRIHRALALDAEMNCGVNVLMSRDCAGDQSERLIAIVGVRLAISYLKECYTRFRPDPIWIGQQQQTSNAKGRTRNDVASIGQAGTERSYCHNSFRIIAKIRIGITKQR